MEGERGAESLESAPQRHGAVILCVGRGGPGGALSLCSLPARPTHHLPPKILPEKVMALTAACGWRKRERDGGEGGQGGCNAEERNENPPSLAVRS